MNICFILVTTSQLLLFFLFFKFIYLFIFFFFYKKDDLGVLKQKRVLKQMVSSTITVLLDSLSHQIMSGLRSVQGRWLGSA